MATIQELLEQRAGGTGQARSDVDFLLKQIRQRMQQAQMEDKQLAKNIKSGGKTALEGIKTRKDFLLAKRGNPNLSIKDFILDDRTAGKYMEQGAESIASGKSPAIGLKETFNPFSKNYARNLNVERSNESAEMLKNLRRSATPSSEASFFPDQELNAMPGFDNYSNLASPPPPPAMGDVSGEGLSSLLSRGRTPFVPEVTQQYASPSQAASMTKANPIQMEAVDAIQSPLSGIRKASEGLGNIESVPTPDVPLGQASKLGTAGKALGGIGSALSLGSGIKDIAKGKGDLSAVAKTAGGALGLASTLGLANPLFGLGFGLLSKLSQRR